MVEILESVDVDMHMDSSGAEDLVLLQIAVICNHSINVNTSSNVYTIDERQNASIFLVCNEFTCCYNEQATKYKKPPLPQHTHTHTHI